MLIPAKHENLEKNLLVVGSDVIYFLKKSKYDIESLFQRVKEKKNINIDQFYNTLTFLWITGIIERDDFYIKLNK